MDAVAKWNYVRIAPQKARLVADLVRGLAAEAAVDVLARTNKRAAGQILKVLRSAVANAEDLGGEVEELRIKSIVVNEGPRMKRMRAAARGRPAPYVHRLAHIVVTVTDDEPAGQEGSQAA
ncbi:MAG: 50S ribosomal protein L22 [Bryobacterales bacterium]|nr:50S ribosomal protein L22 [Bryobacterales bacterium]